MHAYSQKGERSTRRVAVYCSYSYNSTQIAILEMTVYPKSLFDHTQTVR
jgi:hypothetical protein